MLDEYLSQQNHIAEQRIRAERAIGQRLAASNATNADAASLGLSIPRARNAMRLAQILDDDLDAYITATVAAGRELTLASVLRLAPITRREASKSVADAYSAPPIDVQLARVLGMHEMDIRTEWLERALRRAIKSIDNPKHRRAWLLANGISENGEVGDPWPISKVAAHMGVSPRYAGDLYLRGYVPILESLLRASLDHQAALMAAM